MKNIAVANNKIVGGENIINYIENGISYNITMVAVDDNIYDECIKNPNKYIYSDGNIIINPLYNEIVSIEKKEILIQRLYNMKCQKAYGGVVINDSFIFETNQTAVTNTVATLALMNDTDKSSWKFYTKTGVPIMQTVNKAQLFAIASFGRHMIDDSFRVEGEYLAILGNATVDDIISENWVNTFIQDAQTDFDEISNELDVSFDD